MRMSKKAVTFTSFLVGGLIFVTTAFADVALGSGYDKLKDSMKHTAEQMEKSLNNYTFEMLYTLKDNGRDLVQRSSVVKIDSDKNASEETTVNEYTNGTLETHYSYTDANYSVWKNGNMDEKYYVTEFQDNENQKETSRFSNPFKEKTANEFEKIFDAVVGNLKNYVEVEERADGGKEYAGSLSEAQVPALVNAVSSYALKNTILDRGVRNEENLFPEIESDISIGKITGRAIENKDGLLESILGEAVLTGRDKQGVDHTLSVSVVLKLSNIGNTIVSKPDLSGKEVEKVSKFGTGFDSRYVGKYKNDIVIEQEGKFVKIGERTLEVIQVDDQNVTGRYYETCKPGFESYLGEVYDFNFEMNQKDNRNIFTYTNSSGEKEMGQLHMGGNGKLYITLNIEIIDDNNMTIRVSNPNRYFDSQLNRVFEE